MFLLFGTTLRDKVLVTVTFICEYCRMSAAQDVYERANKFSLFLVPLFTFSRHYAVVCSNCGGTTSLTREQATNGIEWAARSRQMS